MRGRSPDETLGLQLPAGSTIGRLNVFLLTGKLSLWSGSGPIFQKFCESEAEGYKEEEGLRYPHFQNQDVAGGGLKGVEEADKERVLDVLQDSKLAGDLVTLHQLLVHKLSGHCSLGSFLITFLDDRESAPGKPVEKSFQRTLCVLAKGLDGQPPSVPTEPAH